MQRSWSVKSSWLLNGPLPKLPRTPRPARARASAVTGGMRPFGGSITIDVRYEGLPRSSQCGGGDVAEPTAPALAVSAVSTSNSALSVWSCWAACFCRWANSASVSVCRSPSSGARSKGTLSSGSLVQTPCTSGSPHGVLATADPLAALAATAGLRPALPTWAPTAPVVASIAASATTPAVTIQLRCFMAGLSERISERLREEISAKPPDSYQETTSRGVSGDTYLGV